MRQDLGLRVRVAVGRGRDGHGPGRGPRGGVKRQHALVPRGRVHVRPHAPGRAHGDEDLAGGLGVQGHGVRRVLRFAHRQAGLQAQAGQGHAPDVRVRHDQAQGHRGHPGVVRAAGGVRQGHAPVLGVVVRLGPHAHNLVRGPGPGGEDEGRGQHGHAPVPGGHGHGHGPEGLRGQGHGVVPGRPLGQRPIVGPDHQARVLVVFDRDPQVGRDARVLGPGREVPERQALVVRVIIVGCEHGHGLGRGPVGRIERQARAPRVRVRVHGRGQRDRGAAARDGHGDRVRGPGGQTQGVGLGRVRGVPFGQFQGLAAGLASGRVRVQDQGRRLRVRHGHGHARPQDRRQGRVFRGPGRVVRQRDPVRPGVRVRARGHGHGLGRVPGLWGKGEDGPAARGPRGHGRDRGPAGADGDGHVGAGLHVQPHRIGPALPFGDGQGGRRDPQAGHVVVRDRHHHGPGHDGPVVSGHRVRQGRGQGRGVPLHVRGRGHGHRLGRGPGRGVKGQGRLVPGPRGRVYGDRGRGPAHGHGDPAPGLRGQGHGVDRGPGFRHAQGRLAQRHAGRVVVLQGERDGPDPCPGPVLGPGRGMRQGHDFVRAVLVLAGLHPHGPGRGPGAGGERQHGLVPRRADVRVHGHGRFAGAQGHPDRARGPDVQGHGVGAAAPFGQAVGPQPGGVKRQPGHVPVRDRGRQGRGHVTWAVIGPPGLVPQGQDRVPGIRVRGRGRGDPLGRGPGRGGEPERGLIAHGRGRVHGDPGPGAGHGHGHGPGGLRGQGHVVDRGPGFRHDQMPGAQPQAPHVRVRHGHGHARPPGRRQAAVFPGPACHVRQRGPGRRGRVRLRGRDLHGLRHVPIRAREAQPGLRAGRARVRVRGDPGIGPAHGHGHGRAGLHVQPHGVDGRPAFGDGQGGRRDPQAGHVVVRDLEGDALPGDSVVVRAGRGVRQQADLAGHILVVPERHGDRLGRGPIGGREPQGGLVARGRVRVHEDAAPGDAHAHGGRAGGLRVQGHGVRGHPVLRHEQAALADQQAPGVVVGDGQRHGHVGHSVVVGPARVMRQGHGLVHGVRVLGHGDGHGLGRGPGGGVKVERGVERVMRGKR